jgi:hypothetical protein
LDNVKEGEMTFRCESPQSNLWMEQRYGPQVNPEIFNVLHEEGEPKQLLLDKAGTIQNVTTSTEFFTRGKIETKINALSPTHYGTKTQILRDYKWMARRNLAVAVGELADKEYEETHKEIEAWYFERVKANVENLKKAVVEGQLMSTYIKWDSAPGFVIGGMRNEAPTNILSRSDKEKIESIYGHFYETSGFVLSGGQDRWKHKCIDRDVFARSCVKFRVTTSAAMAAVCGCKVEELPPVLQHFRTEDPYHGNSILDDVDPMEWMPKNPWRQIKWNVFMFFSANAEKDWRKRFAKKG